MTTLTVIILTGAGLGIALLLLLHSRKLNGIHEQLRRMEDVWPARIGETTDSAMMFLPSEAVFAELHAHYPDLIALSHKRRVWIVSPTTIAATLKDAKTKRQAHEDTKQIHTSSEKISKSFEKTERVELEDKPSLPGEDS